MFTFSAVAEFAQSISKIDCQDTLYELLANACERSGIRYFALSHHVDFGVSPRALRLHNYPEGWEEWYDANRFGASDPIHRASQRTTRGFFWRDLPTLIELNPSDHELLSLAHEIGLGDGVTVPAHVPCEAWGSCSFVPESGVTLLAEALPWAQAIGTCAFEAARRLQWRSRQPAVPKLSDRQRQCITLAGRGHTDQNIARDLGIGEQSVKEYLREARARLGVRCRTQLVIGLLAAGELCLEEIWPAASTRLVRAERTAKN